MPTKRLRYLDIAKGITIILMILGHNGMPHVVNLFIYSFHMPLFFIISGMFIKETGFRELFYKGWKQLLKPYVFTWTVIILFFICFHVIKHDLNRSIIIELLCEAMRGEGPVWFLLSLFIAKIIINFIFTRFKKYSLSAVLISAFLGFVGGNSHLFGFIPGYIWAGLIAPLYLFIGKQIYKRDLLNIPVDKATLVIVSGVVLLSSVTMPLAFAYDFPNGIFSVVSSSIITYVIILISQYMEKISAVSALLAFLGNSTLIILCFHTIEMSLNLWKYLPAIQIPLWIVKIIVLSLIPLIVLRVPFVRNIFSK